MVTKNEIKLILSLAQKKFRKKNNLFVAEGAKLVEDLMKSSFEIVKLYVLSEETIFEDDIEKIVVTEDELKKISQLHNPNGVLGLFRMPKEKKTLKNGLVVVLDDIQDPGNLGTIIRLCDWYGVDQLVCSKKTVDCYNPKVIQATMGSIARLSICYLDIEIYLKSSKSPIFTTILKGKNIYKEKLPSKAVIVLGNEANGVRDAILNLSDYQLTIPKYSLNKSIESLNVATATAVVLSEFKRAN